MKPDFNRLLLQFFTGCLFMSTTATTSSAEENLAAVMRRMKSAGAVKMVYRETRTLELMDQPWKGNGYMYSMPPDTLIKEQLLPEHLLMAILGDELSYYDPGNNIRHQGTLDEDDPVSLNIAVFKALMNADQQLLERLYHVKFESDDQQWRIQLKSRNAPDSGFNITVSGLTGQAANHITIDQADGDRSDIELEKVIQDKHDAVYSKINQLKLDLSGN